MDYRRKCTVRHKTFCIENFVNRFSFERCN